MDPIADRPVSTSPVSTSPVSTSRLTAFRSRGLTRRWLRRVLIANLVGQVLIVLSGGVVRLSGSGLGCPTFPECVPGSYTPVVNQPQGWHKDIEFGNRMLTFVLTVLAVLALVVVWRWVRSGAYRQAGPSGPSRRRLLTLGAVPIVGVFAQALIGGISVLTKLNPTVVAVHFLVSMVLITGSTVLLLVAAPAEPRPGDDVAPAAGGPARGLAVALALVTVPLLALGTVVTGSGPHSGDANEPNRFSFDIAAVARLHSGAVWVYTALLVALIVVLRQYGGPGPARRRAWALLGITLAQGVIGYVQYALGVPIGLVAAHMLGAATLVVATTATVFAVFARPEGSPELTVHLPAEAVSRPESGTSIVSSGDRH